MKKTLNKQRAEQAMDQAGLNQAAIAKKLDVTKEAVSQWFKNTTFPRPDKLLKLAKILDLDFNELVIREEQDAPVVAFRKMKGTKTKDHHIEKAQEIGRFLRQLVPWLPFDRLEMPPTLQDPICEYAYLQQVATKVRQDINVGPDSTIDFKHLIRRFEALLAVIVPVLWADKERHENAVHIYLPDSKATWVYLNLDVNIHDFKFWMAHELGHCLSPTLRGEPAEDFADAFAGALLFPKHKAQKAYEKIARQKSNKTQLKIIMELAEQETISPYTVYKELNNYAAQINAKSIELGQEIFSWTSKFNSRHPKVSHELFRTEQPDAKTYISVSEEVFATPFFKALSQYLQSKHQGPGYVQAVMDMPLLDAKGIYEELT